MLIIENTSTDPRSNLQLEENLCSLGVEVFMLWRNSPSVIVGRFQDIDAEVDTGFAERNGIPIVRRNSGGGAVYHDLGNVNYSFIQRDDRRLTLEHFARIIMRTLKAVGINSRLEFRHNDILADGLKISGSAQYRHEGVLLHHGTLLFDSDLSVIPKVLKRYGRVTNIRPLLKHDMTVDEFIRKIFDYCAFTCRS
ncbi:MAG: lipoate--protein ligase family protein [Synergistaceae bacterium]|nr:lipoate--protein ligase family protein [Synergistaceae bacterium]